MESSVESAESEIRILYVDSRSKDLESLQQALLDKGLETSIDLAETKDYFSEALKENGFDILFIRNNLDWIDASDALEVAHTTYPDLPIVILLSQSDENFNVDYLEQGATDCVVINKKMTAQHILKIIENQKMLWRLQGQLKTDQLKIKALDNEKERILSSTSEGIIRVDVHGVINYSNPAALTILEIKEEDLLGQPVTNFFKKTESTHEDCDSNSSDISGKIEKKFQTSQSDYFLYKADTRENIPIAYNSNMIHNEQGDPLGAVIVFQDLSKRIRSQINLAKHACYDELTRLPNRFLLEETFKYLIKKAKRDKKMMSVLFIDIDKFKEVNDTLGHEFGDVVLQKIAKRFREVLRNSDILARFGGDEFVVLNEDIKRPENAAYVAENLISTLRQPIIIRGKKIVVGASIGISIYSASEDDYADSLVKKADIAMYRAKEQGDNHYEFYLDDTFEVDQELVQIKYDSYDALEKQQLIVYFQPQYSVKSESSKIVGFEALLRWNHPEKGLLLPGKFIQVLLETKQLGEVSFWVLKQICKQRNAWLEAGLIDEEVTFSINVSTSQLQKGFMTNVRSVLEFYKVPPDVIEIEITETEVMAHFETSLSVLNEISDEHLTVAMDDFGTGYASLAYLTKLPISSLKIDGAFIKNILEHRTNQEVVKLIIKLGESLDLKVIAECVETKEQFEYLFENGCYLLQGFYFCKPLPVEEITQMLLEQKEGL